MRASERHASLPLGHEEPNFDTDSTSWHETFDRYQGSREICKDRGMWISVYHRAGVDRERFQLETCAGASGWRRARRALELRTYLAPTPAH
ncbi:hypothetical protein EVAR_47021_1 [Eumeta japonica]|uniref:Uncharacterized protein n=1 Tax=Eumeta variegata TaxID=151549 RepID=A0A4C1XJA5_EUMVA|nr:hypothetical protein EVAR_47021_1 [Eumeta japonica]